MPSEVTVTLRQGFGETVPPVVDIGDRVSAGQIIGIDDNSCSSPVHATISGVVAEIRSMSQGAKAVVIRSDGSGGWVSQEAARKNVENCDPDEIGKALYLSGVASLGSSGFPTRYNTSRIQPEDVESLLINAVKSEPFALKNEILLSEGTERFTKGLCALRRSFSSQVEVHVAIDDRDKQIIRKLEESEKWIHIHPLKSKYPQDHDVILTETVLGKNIPYGGSVSDVGVVIMDVQAVLHAYEAVTEGKPVMDRIIALGGTGARENLYLKVRVGTPLENIIASRMKGTDNRCIIGGIMAGNVCDDLSIPVDRTTSSIAILETGKSQEFLSFLRAGSDRDSFTNSFLSSFLPKALKGMDADINGEHRPCVYCNYCESVCPAGLMPYLLDKFVTHDMIEEAERHGIMKCIDCGLCTYVCPSKILLMTHIREGKNLIREEIISNQM